MYGDDNFNYEDLGNSILEERDRCSTTSCIRNLIDFLQDQVDILEDECYERENNLQELFNEDE